MKILVSLYDVKADSWTPPHVCESEASAIREFAMLVNDHGGTIVSNSPADFDLFKVAEWHKFEDEKRPVLRTCDFKHLANGIDLKVKNEKVA